MQSILVKRAVGKSWLLRNLELNVSQMEVQSVTDLIGICGIGVLRFSSDAEWVSDCFA